MADFSFEEIHRWLEIVYDVGTEKDPRGCNDRHVFWGEFSEHPS